MFEAAFVGLGVALVGGCVVGGIVWWLENR